MAEWIKAYKGFGKDMKCRGFQFKEGEEYSLPDGEEAKLCDNGFHACEAPIDCLGYYAPAHSVYHVVELEATDEKGDDSKRVGKRIKIGGKIEIANMVKAQFDYVKEHCTNEKNAEPCEQASVGDHGVASVGDHGVASAGYHGVASAGCRGGASVGYHGVASAGYRGVASAGESGGASVGESGGASVGESGVASTGCRGGASVGSFGVASAGSFGVASAGSFGVASVGESGVASVGESGVASASYRGGASAGSFGVACSRGSAKVGKGGIACVRGYGVKVCGGMDAVLMIAEENEDNYEIVAWKAVVVDGETIKADTWYILKDGELVEEDNEQ